ncbi:hypothetical protein WR25_26199 isoform A [Diploscapter pachys]|uniref:Cofactor of BRCA1 n=1 Tax=Diploscapter pachys TaxID=2018661 RepID=A0A2A2LGK1_9BILA|nr:hypothetical protein WR25_26199 isoform A [Diploscapter pachys]
MQSNTNPAVELELLGIAGPVKIKQVLSKTRKVNTLINAVEKFQEDNGVQIDSLPPALQILDLHDIKRLEFHESAVAELTECLTFRIKSLGEKGTPESIHKLEQQLEKCFRYNHLPPFRPIVLQTLNSLPRVPEKYLKLIVGDINGLYAECSITVRQQIWINNTQLFEDAILPPIDDYISGKIALTRCIEQSSTNFFTCETTKSRRQWKEIQDLLSMVGTHPQLFEQLISYIRRRFADSKDVHLCSLRLELVMAAHDANAETIVRNDPCHDFAFCLDACLRDKHIDLTQANKIKAVLDACKGTDMEMITDLAMIAADVHVVHQMATIAVKKLRDSSGHLPRDIPSLLVIARVLALGAAAADIASSQSLPHEFVDSILFTKFLPTFTIMMLEDTIRHEMARNEGVEVGSEFHSSNFLQPASQLIITFLKANRVAGLLWFHYCLELMPNKRVKDLRGFCRYVVALPYLKEKLASRGVWSHLFFHRLIFSNQFEAALVDQQFHQVIMEDVINDNLQNDAGLKYQLLRLINLIGFIWGVQRCTQMMEKIAPDAIESSFDEYDKSNYAKEFTRVDDKLHPKATPLDDAKSPTKTAGTFVAQTPRQ